MPISSASHIYFETTPRVSLCVTSSPALGFVSKASYRAYHITPWMCHIFLLGSTDARFPVQRVINFCSKLACQNVIATNKLASIKLSMTFTTFHLSWVQGGVSLTSWACWMGHRNLQTCAYLVGLLISELFVKLFRFEPIWYHPKIHICGLIAMCLLYRAAIKQENKTPGPDVTIFIQYSELFGWCDMLKVT